jgi:PAS domain S-box-containing protein
MALLVEEAGTLFATLDVAELLPAIVQLAQRVLTADGHGLWLCDLASDSWRIASASGVSDQYRARTTAAITQRPMTVQMLEPLVVPDIDEAEWMNAEHRAAQHDEGIRAMLVVPLRIAGDVHGTIAFYYREPRTFEDDDVSAAAALGSLAASALRSAELHEELRRTADDHRFLAEASHLLASSLDYETTLSNVAALAVPQFADWCSIDMVGEDGSIRRLTVAHADPAKVVWANEFAAQYEPDLDAPTGVPAVIRTGEPELYPEVTDEMLVESTKDRPELLEVLRELGLRSVMVVPLVARDRPVGAITFVAAESGRQYGDQELELAKHLARRAALAVDNARLFREADRAVAEKEDSLARLRFLGEASELVSSSLDYETTLHNVAALVVPDYADWCAIDLLEPEGTMRRLAVVHRDPAKERWAEISRTRYPPHQEEREGTGKVMQSGKPALYHVIEDELLVESTHNAEHLETLRQLGMRSALVVPLIARGRTFGALMLVSSDDSRLYTEDDLVLAEELARRVSVAVDNARLYRAAEERAQAALALSHVGDGVFLIDRDEVVRLWNPAAEEITGLREADVVGRRADEAVPSWEEFAEVAPDPSAAAPVAGRPRTVPLEIEGRELWLSVSAVVFSEGAVFAFRDLTEEYALDRMKVDFISTVSHELRTPLAAIYGAALTLRRADVKLDEVREDQLLTVVADESERLARIVNEILWASRVESGTIQISIERCDATELARSVVDAARAHLPENIGLALQSADDLPPVAADPDKVLQVLTNLLDNAIKYSPDGGRVVVELDRTGDHVRFAITDEGLGIPAPEQERVFEKFHRLDPNLTRGVGGTGLGLYVCRELVRTMGGRIWVDSREGAGSTFAIELPVAA